MAVFRVNKTDDYTIMSNHHLRNMDLSLKAKGLMSFMLSLPDDWDYSLKGLVSVVKENETAVKAALKELKNNGYLKIQKEKNEKGLFEYIYDIYENPKRLPNLGSEEIEETDELETNIPEVEKPAVDIPTVDEPKVENQPQINTNNQILNNKKKIKKKKDKKTNDEKSCDEIIEDYTDREILKETLHEFIKMRKKIKKPLTEYALKLIIKDLDKLSNNNEDKKIAILNQSIKKGWQGIFELKENNTNNNKSNKQTDTQEYKEVEIDEKDYGKKLKELIKNRLDGG